MGFLADKSYIEGFQPSQADSVVYAALGGAPKAQFANALRWWNHIRGYANNVNNFPGVKKPLDNYGPAGVASAAAAKKDDDDDDDDFDLFEDDSDDEAAEKLKQERLQAYADKKSKKPALIPKSSTLLDVKPWDDETDMKAMEDAVRTIEADGLVWGASKLVPLAYGIKKLQILCVIEDDKIGTDFLEESITEFEDYVQSVDVAAFNKI